MAKRTAAGAVCILLAVLAGITGERYFRLCCVRLLRAAEVPAAASDESVLRAAEEAASLWKRSKNPLGVLLKHSDADALNGMFLLLEEDALRGDAAAARERLRRCRASLGALLEGERFSWQNVLFVKM